MSTEAEPSADVTVQFARPATFKLDIWDRATDAEAEQFEQMIGSVGAKVRGMWRDCRYVDHDSPLFDQLQQMVSAEMGDVRAAELLAPSIGEAKAAPA